MNITSHHIPAHLIGLELASANFFVFSSRMRAEAFQDFFSGIGFTESGLIFGESGYRSFKQAHPDKFLSQELIEGRYLVGELIGSEFIIKTDRAGQFVVYIWREGPHWAISNSLLVLAREVELLGAVPALYAPALAIFSAGAKDRDHGQIVSPNTVLRNAICVPPGGEVKVQLSEKRTPAVYVLNVLPERSERAPDVYLENLLLFISRWRRRIEALAVNDVEMKINLSGGKDSRSVLALLCSVLGTNVRASTKQNASADFNLASKIIESHATLDESASADVHVQLSSSENFALNLLAGGGVKRFSYKAHSALRPRQVIWSGGASFDSVVFRSPLKRRLENTCVTPLIEDETLRSCLLKEYETGARLFPCEIIDENAIFFHYAGYRARHHYGASTRVSGVNALMPLFSHEVSRVFLSAPSFRYIQKSGINYDIVNVCAPYLLKYPFTGDPGRPRLLTEGLALHDLPVTSELKFYGEAPTKTPVEGGRETFGPNGLSVVRALLPEAIRRFGMYFSSHVLLEAAREADSAATISGCRNAAFLCSLSFMFPNDVVPSTVVC